MDASVLLPHRAALTGAAVALAVGLTGGLILRTGSQTAPQAEAVFLSGPADDAVQPIAWPSGKVPDYVIGTDFLMAQDSGPPRVAMASYEASRYTPTTWPELTPVPAPLANEPPDVVQAEDVHWPSVQGDILDTRLPEEALQAAAPSQAQMIH